MTKLEEAMAELRLWMGDTPEAEIRFTQLAVSTLMDLRRKLANEIAEAHGTDREILLIHREAQITGAIPVLRQILTELREKMK